MNEREKGLHPQDPYQVVTYFLFTTWMSVGVGGACVTWTHDLRLL